MIRMLDIDGHRVEARWWGDDSSDHPVLVLLHEGLGCVDLWKDFPRQLAEKLSCRVFAYSRLGYGKSDACPLPRPVTFMHKEAREFLPRVLAAAGITSHILLGHSDGGSIALIYAATAPEGLKAVITEAAHVFCESLTLESIAQAKVAYEKGDLKPRLEKYHGPNTENAFRGWNDVWLNPKFASWNIRELLPDIGVPVLAIQGREDPYGTLDQITAVEGAIPHCTTAILDHCGHAPHVQAPKQTMESITRFLGPPGRH